MGGTLKAIIYIALTQISIVLAGLIFTKLSTTLTSKLEYGLFTLLMSIVSFSLMVGSSSFNQAGARLFVEKNIKVDFLIFFYNIIINILFIFIIFIVINILDTDIGWVEILLIFFLSLFQSKYQILESYYNARLERNRYYIQNLLQSVFKVFIVVCFWKIDIQFDSKLLLLSLIFSFIVPLLLSFKDLKKIFYHGFYKSFDSLLINSKRVLSLSMPVSFLALFSWAKESIPRFLLIPNGFDSVANYAVIVAISTVGSVFLLKVCNLYFYPIIYSAKLTFNDARIFVKKICGLYLVIVIFITIFIHIFAEEIVLLLTTESYVSSARYLAPFFFATSINLIGSFSTHLLYKLEDTKALLTPNFLISLFIIIITVPLVMFCGEFGAATSYFLGYSMSGIILYIYSVTYEKTNSYKV